jgi:hypothetical protein
MSAANQDGQIRGTLSVGVTEWSQAPFVIFPTPTLCPLSHYLGVHEYRSNKLCQVDHLKDREVSF